LQRQALTPALPSPVMGITQFHGLETTVVDQE
jgi:hypothetical protein